MFSINQRQISFVFLLVILITLPLASFGKRTIKLDELELELKKINQKDLSVVIWDQRPQVVDRSQGESFLGYMRSLVQVAWPYFIKGETTFPNFFLQKIKESYSRAGVDINTIESSAFETEEQILRKIKNQRKGRILLITVKEMLFDGYMVLDYMVNIEMEIYSNKGELLKSSSLIDRIEIGKTGKYKKVIPEALKEIFERLLNNADYIKAMDNPNLKNSNTKDIEIEHDIIVRKDGEEIEAKILEMDDVQIKYKRSDYLDGPIIVVRKSDVFMIKYGNGTKEVMK